MYIVAHDDVKVLLMLAKGVHMAWEFDGCVHP